jgi:DNA-directed RNA polymerase subunit RPC12/RpoP
MAGLSLQCAACKAQFRSVEEAQEHAELTKHADFQESTEPVLNLVCVTCGKPCRTQTEKDLHTKRTLHTEFSDKTAEAAKPIVLESSNVGASTSGNVSEANPAQMVQPEVNKELLAELESMGFATPRATRALHFTGASDIETAVSWIVDHEDDPDIDEMPLVCLLDDSC